MSPVGASVTGPHADWTTCWGSEVTTTTVNGHPSRIYARRPPNAFAVVRASMRWRTRDFIVHGDRVVTFDQLGSMVVGAMDHLVEAGVRPGDRVGIYMTNRPEWVALFWAILGAGGIAVPFNGWWSQSELAHALTAVTPNFLVTDAQHRGRATEGVPELAVESIVPTGELPDATGRLAGPLPVDALTENAPAAILFTAGTTGFPKGAVLSHRALVSNLQNLLVVSRKLPEQLADDPPASVTLVGLPLFHIGAIQLILVPMMTGSKIVFLEGKFDAGAVLRLFERERVTMFSGVPTMMERILNHPSVDSVDARSLRTIVLGGSPVSRDLLDRVARQFPHARRGTGQTYGMTETGGVVSTGVGAAIEAHPGSAGRLAPVVEVRIASPDEEGIGEILVRSPSCMDGYWGLPDDPTIDADGWVRTGDLGYVDEEGFLYIRGRSKEVIIRGGENIAAPHVEAALNSHPDVVESAVVGLPDPDWGEIVGAVVRVRSVPPPTVEELTEHVRRQVAHFAVPTRWWFLDRPLPTNDSGKVLKYQLIRDWPSDDASVSGS
jgi:Acyl-CoA synthetases (AMP-forming)/AMP-acid ligases II